VLDKLRTLLKRGETARTLRKGIDPLHMYVTLVSLAYFHKSNAYTLSRKFATEMLEPSRQAAHKAQRTNWCAPFSPARACRNWRRMPERMPHVACGALQRTLARFRVIDLAMSSPPIITSSEIRVVIVPSA